MWVILLGITVMIYINNEQEINVNMDSNVNKRLFILNFKLVLERNILGCIYDGQYWVVVSIYHSIYL